MGTKRPQYFVVIYRLIGLLIRLMEALFVPLHGQLFSDIRLTGYCVDMFTVAAAAESQPKERNEQATEQRLQRSQTECQNERFRPLPVVPEAPHCRARLCYCCGKHHNVVTGLNMYDVAIVGSEAAYMTSRIVGQKE